MLTPSKFTTFDEAIIFKMLSVLRTTAKTESIMSAFSRTKNNFNDAGEFMYALDALYILEKINIDFDAGTIIYAD